MSADNWGICPKCKDRHEETRAALVKRLDDEYGVLDRADYKKLEELVSSTPEEYDEEELREDYEFYLNAEGWFIADYGAHCCNDECDFKFNFKHEQDVDTK